MRARYYNADRGRFLSEDPVWDENLFPYGNNNPATNIDPNGDCPICLVLGEAGFGIATGYGIAKLTGQDYTWKNAAFDGALGAITAGASIYADIAKIGTKGVDFVEGSFSTFNWKGYPVGGIKPTGQFKLLEGTEYTSARNLANSTNAAIRRANPEIFKGLQIHEIHPVKFGGSPTDISNKIFLTPSQHAHYTNFWNTLMRKIK